jgi:hypothetical protein
MKLIDQFLEWRFDVVRSSDSNCFILNSVVEKLLPLSQFHSKCIIVFSSNQFTKIVECLISGQSFFDNKTFIKYCVLCGLSY